MAIKKAQQLMLRKDKLARAVNLALTTRMSIPRICNEVGISYSVLQPHLAKLGITKEVRSGTKFQAKAGADPTRQAGTELGRPRAETGSDATPLRKIGAAS